MPPARVDIHFATDHLLDGLKVRTISSGIVTGSLQVISLILNLASVVILARLLTPQDFGLLAMVVALMGFFRVFNEAGLSAATVQKAEITHQQVSNLFWANIALGGIITLILVLAAPLVAWFYQEPRAIAVTMALSATFLFTSGTVQHQALLKRQMRFKALALIQVTSVAIGIIVGIAMAWFDLGYWSLVGMQLATPVAGLLMTWSVCSWRPQFPARDRETRFLLQFGANLSASGFLWSVAKGLDCLLIGRFFGSEALGLYSRAENLLNRPLQQAMGPLEAVFVPTFSRLQAHPQRYRRTALQVFDILAVSGFLISSLLLGLSDPVTLLVLGPQWIGIAPIFRAFTLLIAYIPVICVVGWLLTSQGRGKDFLILSSIASIVTIPAFMVGLYFGPVGMALSYSLSCLFIHMPVAFYIAGRSHVVTTNDLWLRFIVHSPIWVVVYCAISAIEPSLSNSSPIMQVCILGASGILAGAVFVYAYPASRNAVLNLLRVFSDWRRSPAILDQ